MTIPDARWWAPVNPDPTCDCRVKAQAAGKVFWSDHCEQCESWEHRAERLAREADDAQEPTS